ncbi:MAG: Sir2 family NAD-dependent protein deacetylase [Rhodoglobus sp.]
MDTAISILTGKSIVVLTGAGVSTDSGIPDYRGAGAPARSPMTFQHFLSDFEYQKRYWAGSHFGWKRFSAAVPNNGHVALVELERRGAVNGIITQNVDGLHQKAGSQRVVDLHGSMDRVCCLDCGQYYSRSSIADHITSHNPWIDHDIIGELGPDGDVGGNDITAFVMPRCTVCSGVLKPDVVFFGEYLPQEKFEEASALVASGEAFLVAGSSLAVNSGVRLLEQARRRRLPIVIINRGVTKGDSRASVKIDAGTSETLVTLLHRLSS